MVVGYRGLVVGYGILFLDPRHSMCHFVFVVALNLSKSTVGIWDNALIEYTSTCLRRVKEILCYCDRLCPRPLSGLRVYSRP